MYGLILHCRTLKKEIRNSTPDTKLAFKAKVELRISSVALLLGGAGFGGGVGVFLGEAFDAAGGIHELLLAGEKRVAIGADFDAHHVAFDGRARLKRVAAGAVHRNGMIIGMNSGFHGAAFRRVRSARHTRQGREFEAVTKDGHTAASLGREQFSIIREESNSAKSVG